MCPAVLCGEVAQPASEEDEGGEGEEYDLTHGGGAFKSREAGWQASRLRPSLQQAQCHSGANPDAILRLRRRLALQQRANPTLGGSHEVEACASAPHSLSRGRERLPCIEPAAVKEGKRRLISRRSSGLKPARRSPTTFRPTTKLFGGP